MKKLKLIIYALLCFGIATTRAQTITDLHSYTNGEDPRGSLTFYSHSLVPYLVGMTPYGGNSYNDGQIFEYNLNTNTYTDLYNFSGSDGANPYGSLLPYLVGPGTVMFYGMTYAGGTGSSAVGTIFSYDPNTYTLITLHTFTGVSVGLGTSDGANPYGSLIMYSTTGGNYLLGMTYAGGYYGYGMIFSCLSTYPYTFTDLHDFNGPYSYDGSNPYGDLTLVENNGDVVVYGMTSAGGINGEGNIFSYDLITTAFNDLYDFQYNIVTPNYDGQTPYGNLLYTATAGGTLYGMTSEGGTDNQGTIFSYNLPTGTETPLFNFYCFLTPNPCIAEYPQGSLAMAGDKLFGMVWAGGSGGPGLIFSYDPYTNSFNDIGDFNGSNGSTPYGNVTLETGVLYGMTSTGGSGGSGTGVIFQLGSPSSPICDIYLDTSSALPTCYGNSDGELSVSPFYGVAPYTYTWSSPPGGATSSITGLSADAYTVTVTDANGCSASQSMVLSQPAQLSLSFEWDCYMGEGDAYALVSGGTPTYTYLWAPGGNTNSYGTGLTGNFYTVTVTDANECTTSGLVAPCLMHHNPSHHEQEEDSIAQVIANISLYPNPTNGQFTAVGLDNGMFVEIYDYTGRLVSKIAATNETMKFNLSGQSDGIYLVRIIASDGTLVKETKVVKIE